MAITKTYTCDRCGKISEPQINIFYMDYEQGFCFLSTTDGTISTAKNVADYAREEMDKPKPEWCPFEKLEEVDTAEYIDNKLYVQDADESAGHLCNSLNTLQGVCFGSSNDTMVRIGYYLFRAQITICYLRDRVKELEENV